MKPFVFAALALFSCQATSSAPAPAPAQAPAALSAPAAVSAPATTVAVTLEPATPAAAVSGAAVPVATQEKPAKAEKPTVYNEVADAKADIAAALERASANHRRVLLQWGANWCGWCIKLHGLYKSDREISKELLYEYDVVFVDIGKWDKNTDLATLYGADLKTGVPYLTVLDESGKVLANQETGVLEDPAISAHDPAKVLGFLKQNQAEYLKAADLLADAQTRAASEHKRVFLTFGAPWCGWCHKLENWMATAEVKALLAKDFVIRKIDVDRTVGGQELYTSYRSANDGIPWFCVIDAAGKPLATSVNDKDENIGFPSKDDEIAVFGNLLAKVAKNLSAADIETLKASLVEVREGDKRKRAP